MGVGMKLKISAEDMGRGDKDQEEMSFFTTRIAEESFTGMRNNYMLLQVLWTGRFMITQLYCSDDLLAKRILVLG